MKSITSILLAITMAFTLASFTGCGAKPSVSTGPQPLRFFKVEEVAVDSGKVVFSLPFSFKAFSKYQVYAVYYIYADSAWVFSTCEDYQVGTKNLGMKLSGYMYFPPDSKTEWVSLRTWAICTPKGSASTPIPIRKEDQYYREDVSGKPGYEFIVNLKTGEYHPVKKRE